VTVFLDAEQRAVLGDARHTLQFHSGQMSSGDKSEARFADGRNGMLNLIRKFDIAANDPRASAAERAECARARDIVAGTLAGLESTAR